MRIMRARGLLPWVLRVLANSETVIITERTELTNSETGKEEQKGPIIPPQRAHVHKESNNCPTVKREREEDGSRHY